MTATVSTLKDPKQLIGRFLDSLSIEERAATTGLFAALEIYTPETLPVRRIEALADSAIACIDQLQGRGLDPTHFEFVRLKSAYD
jgi:hypothetical protein